MRVKTQKTKSNQRPKELSDFVFWLPSKFGNLLAGGNEAYLKKIRKAERPVIYIERDKGSYPYQVLLDVVEGFSHSRVDLTQETILEIRKAFKSRKTAKRCLEQLDCSRRVFNGNYKTVEDAIAVANLLCNFHYEIE